MIENAHKYGRFGVDLVGVGVKMDKWRGLEKEGKLEKKLAILWRGVGSGLGRWIEGGLRVEWVILLYKNG